MYLAPCINPCEKMIYKKQIVWKTNCMCSSVLLHFYFYLQNFLNFTIHIFSNFLRKGSIFYYRILQDGTDTMQIIKSTLNVNAELVFTFPSEMM